MDEAQSIAARLRDATEASAVALGFAAGQLGWGNEVAGVTFCAATNDFYQHLVYLVEELDQWGPEPTCFDLVLEAERVGPGDWRLSRIEIEGIPLNRVAEVAEYDDVIRSVRPTALAAVPLDAALGRVDGVLARLRAADAGGQFA